MMKIVLKTLVFVFIWGGSYFCSAQNQYKVWSKENKLTWNDFKGTTVPDSLSKHFAVSFVKYEWENYKLFKDSFVIDLVCYFSISKSWKRETVIEDLDLLNHEQRHFDLAEIVTRRMRMELLLHESTDIDSTIMYFNFIAKDKYVKERSKLMLQYDKETDHGRHKAAQKRWDIKIDQLLNETKEYSNPRMVIKRK